MSAFSAYPFSYILAIPSVKLVRDRSKYSLVITLILGSRSKTPVGFGHLLIYLFLPLGWVYHTTCYTDIGIGELVIHLLCGMDPLCIVRGHDLVYLYHRSALYFWRLCSHWAWVCPPQDICWDMTFWLLLQVFRQFLQVLTSPLLHQRYLLMHFGHQYLFWSHALGGICYSWDLHYGYIW